MRLEQVEIYEDDQDFAVMRHPGRHNPGSLIPGRTLYALYIAARELMPAVDGPLAVDFSRKLDALRDDLGERLFEYEEVLRLTRRQPISIAETEIYSDATNAAVMRHPDHAEPGSLLQGDTLSSLYHRTCDIARDLNAGEMEEVRLELEGIQQAFGVRVRIYLEALAAVGRTVPFPAPDG